MDNIQFGRTYKSKTSRDLVIPLNSHNIGTIEVRSLIQDRWVFNNYDWCTIRFFEREFEYYPQAETKLWKVLNE